MCDEWRNSFPAFRAWSLANGYSKELQIDRIDNDKGYSPDNCRWVTPAVNQSNRRRSIIFPGGKTTLDVAKQLGITPSALRTRLKSGMSKEQAMSLPMVPNGASRRWFGIKK